VRLPLIALLVFLDSISATPWWTVQTADLDSNLRGISVAYGSPELGKRLPIVWASGSNGVVLKSVDEGKTWKQLTVPNGEKLDFRGIVAFNEKVAYLMSSGEAEKSRIYKTADAGKTWTLQYSDSRNEFFLDSIACLSENDCLALSDPVDGKFLLIHTTDGLHWSPLSNDHMPAALKGEGAFAASNSSLLFAKEKEIFFATGGPSARVFHSPDLGRTWTVSETPIAHADAASGIFALGMDRNHKLVAVGGDYNNPNITALSAAYSLDESSTWQLSAQLPGGYRSALAQIGGNRWIAVGPNGSDLSDDSGIHWIHGDSLNLNAAAILDIRTGWAVGPHGTIARFANHFPSRPHPRLHRHKTRP
jgi:photosystem II stability/assembly factor-like uncharacterized protein